jgi:hypothetical protein
MKAVLAFYLEYLLGLLSEKNCSDRQSLEKFSQTPLIRPQAPIIL